MEAPLWKATKTPGFRSLFFIPHFTPSPRPSFFTPLCKICLRWWSTQPSAAFQRSAASLARAPDKGWTRLL